MMRRLDRTSLRAIDRPMRDRPLQRPGSSPAAALRHPELVRLDETGPLFRRCRVAAA